MLLTGCDGGGSGSSTPSNTDSNLTRYSSDYEVSD